MAKCKIPDSSYEEVCQKISLFSTCTVANYYGVSMATIQRYLARLGGVTPGELRTALRKKTFHAETRKGTPMRDIAKMLNVNVNQLYNQLSQGKYKL